jgi:hypothetical protein
MFLFLILLGLIKSDSIFATGRNQAMYAFQRHIPGFSSCVDSTAIRRKQKYMRLPLVKHSIGGGFLYPSVGAENIGRKRGKRETDRLQKETRVEIDGEKVCFRLM